MKQFTKSSCKKVVAITAILLLVISMGATLGIFTASVVVKYSTNAAGLNQTADFLVSFDTDYDDISEGEGRQICYTVNNNESTVATTNQDTITFTFVDFEENPVAVTSTDLPLQLYWFDDTIQQDSHHFTPRAGASPLTPASASGNTITYNVSYNTNTDADNVIDLVAIFNPDFTNAAKLNGGNVQCGINTFAKIQDRPFTVWSKQNNLHTDCCFMGDYFAGAFVAAVYNTGGDFIGQYTTLSEAFAVAEQTAALDAEDMSEDFVQRPYYFEDCVHVRIEMLVENYEMQTPITLNTDYLITLSHGYDLGDSVYINSAFNAPMFTVPEGSMFRVEEVSLTAESGNCIANYGTLYTDYSITKCGKLSSLSAPTIYNATTGTIYTNNIFIADSEADLGAGIYSCGTIVMNGDNQIGYNFHSNGSTPSNIYLATENAAIYVGENFDVTSNVGVSAATFLDKTMVYTLDTNRYTSTVEECFIFERKDLWALAGYEAFYYDAEFYMAAPFVYKFNESNKTYTPQAAGQSVPRLGDFAPYILADGTPCAANADGAYACTKFDYLLANTPILRELWIPETVTYITNGAFVNDTNLSRVYWQTTQATINGQSSPLKGNNQLAVLTSELGCTPTNGDQDNTIYFNPAATNIPTNSFRDINLQSVNLSNSSITQISDYAFAWCTKLTSIHLPSELKIIGPYAFKTCSSLTSITVPSKVELVDISAFANCTQLSKVYWNAVNAAGNANSYNIQNYPIFDGCTSLTTLTTADVPGAITLSPNVESLPAGFVSRTKLQLIDLTDAKISIIPEYFAKGSTVKTVKFSPNTLVIKNYAFDTCIYLENCVLPNTVTSIGNYAFYCNLALPTINIPESVTTVGISCFKSCSKLSKVYWNAVNTSTNVYQTINYPIFGDCPLLTSITTDDIANAIVVSPAVTGFQDGLFCYMPNLTIVNLKNTQLKSIPTSCFYSCTSLIDVLYPETVTSMKQLSFGYCSALSEFTISPNITNVEIRVFEGCTSLSKVYWNAPAATCNSAGSQSLGVFKGCTSLTKVDTVDGNNTIVLATNCTKLPSGMFAGSSITSINLYNTSITAIPDYLCYNCTALTFLKMPNGKTTSATLTSVGTNSFVGCTSLNYTVIRAERLTVAPTSFNDNFTIYYTGDEGTITGANNTLTIVYCWCDDECLVDANGVITELVSAELLAADVLDLTGIVYVNSTNDLQTPLAYIKAGALDTSVATHVKFPNWHEPTEWDADVLPGNTVEATFMAEGYEDLLPNIWSTTSLNIVHYMKDGELLTATRPVKNYYTVLEWIESTGDEYIDAKILADNYLVFGVDFMQYNMNSSTQYVFGAQTANKLSDYGLYADTYPHLKFSGSTHNLSTFTSATYFEKRCTFTEYWRSGYHFWTLQSADGTKMSTNLNDPNNFANPQNIYIFALNNAGTAESFSRTRLYSMKIWNCDYPGNGNILARDFIPVLDQYGVACLYDKVSGELFYPQKKTLIPGPATGETIALPGDCAECGDIYPSDKLCEHGVCIDCGCCAVCDECGKFVPYQPLLKICSQCNVCWDCCDCENGSTILFVVEWVDDDGDSGAFEYYAYKNQTFRDLIENGHPMNDSVDNLVIRNVFIGVNNSRFTNFVVAAREPVSPDDVILDVIYEHDSSLFELRNAPCADCGTTATTLLCPDGYCKTCALLNGCHGYCSKHGGWLSSDFCETCGEHLHCEDSSYISKVTHCASCCTTINLRSWSETYYYPGLYNLCLDCELCLDCCTCENSHIYFRIKLYNSSNSTTSYYSFQAYKNQTWAEFCADPEAQRWTGTEITPVDGYLQDVKSGKWLTVDGRRVLANEAIWDTYASCESMPELLDAWTVKCPGCNLECYIHELCPDGLCAACALDNDCHVYCEECGWSTEFCSWCETCICTSEFTCPNPDIDGCVETSVLCPHCGYCSNCHNDLPILDGSDICIHCSECDIYLDYYNNILENRCYACDRCLDCCNCENTLILFYIDTGANNYGYRAYKNQDFRTWLNSSFAAEYEKSYRFVLSDGGFICEINSGQYLYTNGRLVHADELIWDVVIGDSLYLDDASGCAHCGIVTDMLCPDGYCLDCAADYDIGGWCHGYCEDCGWTEDWCFDCAKCACKHETISCPDGCEFQRIDTVFCHCGYCSEQHDEYHHEYFCDHCDTCGTWMFNEWSEPGDPINRCDNCGLCLDCCACNSGYTLDEDGNIIGIDWTLWYDESEYTEDTIPHHVIPDNVWGLTTSGKPMQATGVKGEEALSSISLGHLTLPASISYIDPMFFNGVTELTELTILNPDIYSQELNDAIFARCSFLEVIHWVGKDGYRPVPSCANCGVPILTKNTLFAMAFTLTPTQH